RAAEKRAIRMRALLSLELFSSACVSYSGGGVPMIAFLLWCFLFVLCWPVALLALILYPIVWLLLLPFRLVGIAVHGALALVWAAVMLPARLLSAPFRLSRI
ncbi:MAG: hypothetical protein WBP69_09560, partial [Terriglobales bacterium]